MGLALFNQGQAQDPGITAYDMLSQADAENMAAATAAATSGLGQSSRPTFDPNIPSSQDIFNKPLNELVSDATDNQLPQETIDNLIDAKDTQFRNEINDLGGMTKDNVGEVIAITEKIYGEGDDRGKVVFLTEALKDGVTTQDLSEATGLSQQDIFDAGTNAVDTAIQKVVDPAVNLIKQGIELVEKGAEVTGVEKVINAVGNATSRAIGLDPGKTQKTAVVNPVTGQVTVQASNQPGGGIFGKLPQSPFIPVNTTSGGTTYGIDVENAVANVVLGQISTQGTLDSSNLPTIIGAAIEDATGIPTEAATTAVNSAIEAAGAVGDILTGGEDQTGGTTLTIATSDDDKDEDTTAFDALNGTGADTNGSTLITTTQDTCPEGQMRSPFSGECVTDYSKVDFTEKTCPPGTKLEGQTIASNEDCDPVDAGDTGTTLTGDTDDGCPEGQMRSPFSGNCVIDYSKVDFTSKDTDDDDEVCGIGTKLAGQPIPEDGNCNPVVPVDDDDPFVPVDDDDPFVPTYSGRCPTGSEREGILIPSDEADKNAYCNPSGPIITDDDDDPCPAGMTRNSVTGQCEYIKVDCGPGYTLNPFTGQCEKDEDDVTPDVTTDDLPPITGGVPSFGDFVTRDDVLVEFDKPDYDPYSILPAPATEAYLAGRRPGDIAAAFDVLGFRPAQGLEQRPETMERVERYAQQFGVGPQDAPTLGQAAITPFEDRFGINIPDVSRDFPVRPEEPISQPRYNPLTFGQEPEQPTEPLGLFARGGVAESSDGIGSLMERRAGAVNRMLLNKAGMNFGQR